MKSDSQQKNEGMPEIAQKIRQRKPIIFIAGAFIFIIILSLLSFNRAHKKIMPSLDESYNLPQIHSDLPKPEDNQSVLSTKPQATVSPTVEPSPVLTQEQVALIQAKQNELQQRLSAPLMLVNNTIQNKVDSPVQSNSQSTDRNTQFMNQVSAQTTETVEAKSIGALNSIIAEGNFIHAILESATNSDLPGFVRAIVDEPSYSEDGTTILIPRGSRLIGQYKSGMLQGQSRIFMAWTRLITPSGTSIQLGSPGVDSLGVAGLGADEIDRHFWQRFGTASLLSIIGAGAANVGVTASDQANSAAAYRAAMANSFSASANESLQQDSKIPPTLTTYQGKPIMVFVAKDLSFKTIQSENVTQKTNIW